MGRQLPRAIGWSGLRPCATSTTSAEPLMADCVGPGRSGWSRSITPACGGPWRSLPGGSSRWATATSCTPTGDSRSWTAPGCSGDATSGPWRTWRSTAGRRSSGASCGCCGRRGATTSGSTRSGASRAWGCRWRAMPSMEETLHGLDAAINSPRLRRRRPIPAYVHDEEPPRTGARTLLVEAGQVRGGHRRRHHGHRIQSVSPVIGPAGGVGTKDRWRLEAFPDRTTIAKPPNLDLTRPPGWRSGLPSGSEPMRFAGDRKRRGRSPARSRAGSSRPDLLEKRVDVGPERQPRLPLDLGELHQSSASRTPARSASAFQWASVFATSGLLPGSAVMATFFQADSSARSQSLA